MARTTRKTKQQPDQVQLDLFLAAMYDQYGAGQAPAASPAKPLNPYARHLQRMRAMRVQEQRA